VQKQKKRVQDITHGDMIGYREGRLSTVMATQRARAWRGEPMVLLTIRDWRGHERELAYDPSDDLQVWN